VGKRDRHHRSWLPVLLVLVLVGGAVAVWRLDLGARWFGDDPPDPITEPAAVPPPEGIEVPDLPQPSPVAEPAEGGRLLLDAVRRAVASGTADPDLGRSVHVAVSPLSGPGAAYVDGTDAFIPASTR